MCDLNFRKIPYVTNYKQKQKIYHFLIITVSWGTLQKIIPLPALHFVKKKHNKITSSVVSFSNSSGNSWVFDSVSFNGVTIILLSTSLASTLSSNFTLSGLSSATSSELFPDFSEYSKEYASLTFNFSSETFLPSSFVTGFSATGSTDVSIFSASVSGRLFRRAVVFSSSSISSSSCSEESSLR